MKVGLTFACMNLKKLAMMLQKSGRKGCLISTFFIILGERLLQTEKNGARTTVLAPLCLQSDTCIAGGLFLLPIQS
jgi:hypothetical protein